MTLRSWLRKLLSRKTPSRLERWRTSPRKESVRKALVLEVLEDRTLLSGTSTATLQLLPAAGQSTSKVALVLDSFRFGFHHGIGSGSAVTFDALDVTASFTANSPQVFANLTEGQAYQRAVLTQKDASNNTVGIWILDDVQVTDDAVTGTGSGVPGESLKFAFAGVGQGVGTHIATWNQVTNSPANLDVPDPADPAAAPTRMTLALAGGTATPVSIDLSSFQFGSHDPVTFGSAGATPGRTSFAALDVTAALTAAGPDLLSALTTGHFYDTGTLTQYDAAGNPAAVWVLGTVFVTDDNLTGSDHQATQDLKFAFGSATEATSTTSGSWSLLTGDASGPALPSGLTLDALPAPAATGLTLQLYSNSADTTPAATLNLSSFAFGFHNGTRTGGVVSFDGLDVTVGLGSSSPALFAALTGKTPYARARLTQSDATGKTTAVWALSSVYVTDDRITGSGLGLPGEELTFAFGALAQGVGTHVAGWSQVTNSSTSSDIPTVPDPVPPAVAPTRMTLDLAGGTAIPVSIDLSSFQFGFHDPATVGATALVPGTTAFDALDVTAPLSDAAPALFAALTTGDTYDTGTLTQYDAAGNPTAVWVLGTVSVLDDSLVPGDQATQELKLGFVQLTEVANPNQASWDLAGQTATGPQGPDPSSLDTLAVYAPTLAVSAGPFSYDGTAHPAAAAATGVTGDPVSGTFTFTYYAGDSVGGTGSATAPTRAGDYTVVAHFRSADADYADADSTPLTFQVAQAGTGTTVISSANPAVYGQALTFTATVSNTSGGLVPTGTVQFLVDGVNFGGPVALDARGNAVSPSDVFLSGASHGVQAVYKSSDGNFTGSSGSRTQTMQTVAVGPDPSNPALTDLFFGSNGATSNDVIRLMPAGSSNTGGTGIQVRASLNRVLTETTYWQSFATVHAFLRGGNDYVQAAGTLTINAVVRAGNGNDTVTAGGGNWTVTLGDGNDTVLLGGGNDTVTLGNGNDGVQLGNGNDVVTAGRGNDNVRLGGGNNTVTLGDGNDTVLAGDGNCTVTLGNGNDSVRLGGGNNTVTLGNGNDGVRLGNGNNVVVTGNGNDAIQAGNGDNLIAAGLGRHSVAVGNGSNILIDGSVALTGGGDSLRQVLNDWVTSGAAAAARIRSRLAVTLNRGHANTLYAGRGLDWFWDTYARDSTNRKVTDLLN
jgi:type VI protein secretion system component Hcp